MLLLNRICKVIFLIIVIAEEARGGRGVCGDTRESDYRSVKTCLLSSQRMCVRMSD